jgi:hypothetical protein
LSLAQRRNAKPAAQPYLWAGRTSTTDNAWTSAVTGFGVTISLTVDTSAAQFRSPPRYFAHAVGDRQVTVTLKDQKKVLVLDGFSRVADDTSVGFTFSLLIPSILLDHSITLDDLSHALPEALKQWYVEWLGTEG